MSEDFQNWACSTLDQLGLPDASVIIQYLEPLENAKEVREYLNSMLDSNKPKHRKFIEQFLEKQALSKIDTRFYRKSDFSEIQNVPEKNKKKGKDKLVNNGKDSSKNKNKESSIEKDVKKSNSRSSPDSVDSGSSGGSKKKPSPPPNGTAVGDGGSSGGSKKKPSPPPNGTAVGDGGSSGGSKKKPSPPLNATAASTGPKKKPSAPPPAINKKKTKFVNLYSADQDTVMLSGRNVCECLASKHKLVNNCLSCGRIVCEQEGAGPCMFCNTMILSKEEEAGGATQPKPITNKSTKMNKSASVKDVAEDIAKAVKHKDTLLEYDRTSEKRTRVFDDESDYFDSNSRWISKENREILQSKEMELKEKKYDRRNNVVKVDLLGRKIVVDETNVAGVYDPDDPIVKAILEHQPADIFSLCERNNDSPPPTSTRPIYVDRKAGKENVDVNRPLKFPMGNTLSRLQDRELQEMSDQGKCLSMHQPWASLLIAGVKKHEGRTW